MGYTEELVIDIDDLPPKTFKIFSHLPYRVGTEFQSILMEMARDIDVNLDTSAHLDFTQDYTGKKMPDIDLGIIHEAQELLLEQVVISPKINEEVLSDNSHELQPYLKPLGDELMNRFAERIGKKKRSPENGS